MFCFRGTTLKLAEWEKRAEFNSHQRWRPDLLEALILVHLSEIFLILLETESLQRHFVLIWENYQNNYLFLLEISFF